MKLRKKVYVGFCDGVPHVYACEEDGDSCVAVWAKRKDVAERYDDVRVGELVVDVPRISKSKSGDAK